MTNHWTPGEDAVVRDLTLTHVAAAEALPDRTAEAVAKRRQRLGLLRPRPARYTEADLGVLLNEDLSDEEAARELGRHVSAIAIKRGSLRRQGLLEAPPWPSVRAAPMPASLRFEDDPRAVSDREPVRVGNAVAASLCGTSAALLADLGER